VVNQPQGWKNLSDLSVDLPPRQPKRLPPLLQKEGSFCFERRIEMSFKIVPLAKEYALKIRAAGRDDLGNRSKNRSQVDTDRAAFHSNRLCPESIEEF
jgi:hypothetical protein